MKKYKAVNHIALNYDRDNSANFRDAVAEGIKDNQKLGLLSEVQYSTSATNNTVILSALILGYEEE